MIKVAVLGAAGKMGAEVCRAVGEDPDMSLVAAVDKRAGGEDLAAITGSSFRLEVAETLDAVRDAQAEVAVDFTVADAAVANIDWCLDNHIHAVVGTTGISPEQIERLAVKSKAQAANLLIAPNFAIGAVLMIRFAELAAAWLPHAEIVELHHPGKLDAPSGTSLATADGISRGRSAALQPAAPAGDPGALPSGPADSLPARGAGREGVRIHSVRLPGLVAHQEVIFGGQGQTLAIRHDSIDRSSFMPGVLLAIREIGRRPGLTFGLEALLGV